MKIHNSMSENLIVNILESTAPELAQTDLTEGKWTDHLLGMDLPKDFIQQRVIRGTSKAITLQVNGENCYTLVFVVNDMNLLCVQNLVALKPTISFRAIMDWITTKLAPALNVKGVLFDTKSAAVYRLAKSLDFDCVGVILLKKI